jgi:hypothetical protein
VKGSNFAEALETVWRTGESLSRRTASVSEGAVVLAKASLSRNRLGEVGGKVLGGRGSACQHGAPDPRPLIQ